LPIRIYALAKQLKLNSKALVDICKDAGVEGKGSALASLTDQEVEQVTSFISGKSASKPTTAKAPAKADIGTGPVRREDYVAPGGAIGSEDIRVIKTTSAKKKSPLSAKPKEKEEVEEPEPVETVQEPVVEEEIAASVEVAETAPALEKTPEEPAETPIENKPADIVDIPVRPTIEEKRIPVLRTARKKNGNGNGNGTIESRTGPTIKLAPMPISKQKPKVEKKEATQKPDIRLPLDAIRAGRKGEKQPLAKHLETAEKKRAASKKGLKVAGATGKKDESKTTSTTKPRRRGGGVAPAAPAKDGVLGGREQRQLKRKRSSRRRKGNDDRGGYRPFRRIRRTGANTAAPRKNNVIIELPCSVRSFSESLGIAASQVLGKLLTLGVGGSLNINAQIDMKTAELLAVEFGVEVDFRQEVALEEQVITAIEQEEDDPSTMVPRPPVITFLGHVDHGKTSLLDRMIGIDVVSGEKGGITQHIRAYHIKRGGESIAFVDTPGHEAFTEMRARGANVTDIAVLVVAADDGIMPQTEEAISHARAAGVPIVVALNKVDIPGVDIQKVYQELAANELLPSEWGGDTEVVKTSAISGEGIDDLFETLLTVAELHEYKANPDRDAVGTCLESQLDEGRGVMAKVLVEKGTMRVGDIVVCGSTFGRVKAMYNTLKPNELVDEAGPSTPVNLVGLDEAPGAGDRFHVVDEISKAREIAETRAEEKRQTTLSGNEVHVTLENLFDRLGEINAVQTLNIVLRADVRGSIEAIQKELTKLEHPEVQVKILQATVGGVTEADVHLADASDAIVIGFSVVPDEGARILADQKGVQIRRYDIIYQIADDLRLALEGMLKPDTQEAELGRALVQRTYQISRLGTIAGCRVLSGAIERDSRARVIRENRVIGDYQIISLKREKDDAKSVREGYECGIRLKSFNDLKEADILEVYRMEEIARHL
jgi:translation initiation factor IF-2